MAANETIPVTLPSGLSCGLDYDDIAYLSEHSSELITAACDLRNQMRGDTPVFAERGLTLYEAGDPRTVKSVWALPEAYGKLPYGVPILSYSPITPYLHRRYSAASSEDTSESWELTLSNMGHRVIASAKYNDFEGQHRLVDMLLENDPETLAVQLTLMSNQAPNPNSVYTDKTLAQIARLFDMAANMPAVPEGIFRKLNAVASLRVGRVGMIEPSLCRLVHLPQFIYVQNTQASYTREVDKALRDVGAIGLPNRGGLLWGGVERLGTMRGYRKRIGTISSDLNKGLVVSLLGKDPAEVDFTAPVSFAPQGDRNSYYYTSSYYAFAHTVNTMSISLEQRATLLAE